VVNSDRWEVNNSLQASPEGPGRNLFSLERHGQRNNKISTNQIYEERQTIIHCSYTYMRPANQSRPQTVQWLMPDCTLHFSLPKGGPKPDLDPRPPDLHQNVCNIIANTTGKLMAPGRSFWKSTF
jgi:hypothetical protein